MPNRGKCIFSNCNCNCYLKNKNCKLNLCILCYHADVWHKIKDNQFVSSRPQCRKPVYVHESIRFCPSVDDLPA